MSRMSPPDPEIAIIDPDYYGAIHHETASKFVGQTIAQAKYSATGVGVADADPCDRSAKISWRRRRPRALRPQRGFRLPKPLRRATGWNVPCLWSFRL
jgi:hypothetical protein